jgi:hypothetical protein
MELAKQYHLKIFVPSTIGAFGPESPRSGEINKEQAFALWLREVFL